MAKWWDGIYDIRLQRIVPSVSFVLSPLPGSLWWSDLPCYEQPQRETHSQATRDGYRQISSNKGHQSNNPANSHVSEFRRWSLPSWALRRPCPSQHPNPNLLGESEWKNIVKLCPDSWPGETMVKSILLLSHWILGKRYFAT